MTERVERAVAFLRERLPESPYFEKHPEKLSYRLEHTFRVAWIGREIAQREGFDEEEMVLACLLHDVSYCREFADQAVWLDHGRASARIARPFLEELGLGREAVDEICYGIAIHVDGKADFPGEKTAFALSVGDADNIDRFGAFRIGETIAEAGLERMSLAEKIRFVDGVLLRLGNYMGVACATDAATALWRDRVGFYAEYFRRLRHQLASSTASFEREIMTLPSSAAVGPDPALDRLLGLAGRM